MATSSWLIVAFDTDGEVMFATVSTLTHQVINGLPNITFTYSRLRHQ
jgi:hypothetical protein